MGLAGQIDHWRVSLRFDLSCCVVDPMNDTEGLHEIDTDNAPFDSMDSLLTRALWVLTGVAVGMFITAAIIYFARTF